MCMMEDVLKIFQLFFGSPSGRAPQAVKPVLIEDRVVTSMELIAAAHAVLPHVDGRLPGHACSSIAINFATAPSHVSSWAVAGRASTASASRTRSSQACDIGPSCGSIGGRSLIQPPSNQDVMTAVITGSAPVFVFITAGPSTKLFAWGGRGKRLQKSPSSRLGNDR
jgi:hypothetical protein